MREKYGQLKCVASSQPSHYQPDRRTLPPDDGFLLQCCAELDGVLLSNDRLLIHLLGGAGFMLPFKNSRTPWTIFNSRTAIAGAIIGLLLVFTTRRGVLVFSRFFLQEVDLFTRHFDLKAKE